MKAMKMTIIVLAVLVTLSNASAADSYGGVEFYPHSNAFPYFGFTNGKVKADMWTILGGTEVGMTVGPVIGPFAIGYGASLGTVDGETDVIYLNVDLGFMFTFGRVTWCSYNIHQRGQHGTSDFTLFRQDISYKDMPVGIIGHNIQCGAGNDWELFWGPYCNFGEVGPFSATKLCVTADLQDTDSYWAMLRLEF